MTKRVKIGIIGTGKMGRWLAHFFESQGLKVELAGRLTETTPVDLAERAETLLFLSVYNRVGILRDILTVFVNNNLDLAKIESRPSKAKPVE